MHNKTVAFVNTQATKIQKANTYNLRVVSQRFDIDDRLQIFFKAFL